MMRMIEFNNEILAIIVKNEYSLPETGIKFFTPQNMTLQLGFMKREKGYSIVPHYHTSQIRNIKNTSEVLFIKRGRVLATICDFDLKFCEKEVLNQGDFIMLAKCVHSFEMLEESEMIEIKQGPYNQEMDKQKL